jgi:hypothetical protein
VGDPTPLKDLVEILGDERAVYENHPPDHSRLARMKPLAEGHVRAAVHTPYPAWIIINGPDASSLDYRRDAPRCHVHPTSGKLNSRKSAQPRSNTHERTGRRWAPSGYFPGFLMTLRSWLDSWVRREGRGIVQPRPSMFATRCTLLLRRSPLDRSGGAVFRNNPKRTRTRAPVTVSPSRTASLQTWLFRRTPVLW